MKILKQGTLPQDHVLKTECGNCGTIFEFQEKEGRIVHDRDGSSVVVNCPYCTKEIWKSI